jgi:ribonuclease HII
MLRTRFTEDERIEIGIDEAGRGSFWGPIVAGAVILPSDWTEAQRALLIQMKDSKKIAAKKRATLSLEIKKLIPLWGVGVVGAEEINTNGITWANREAFRRAMANLPLESSRLLIDGVLSLDTWKGEQHTIVEGDNQYVAIATASILAKVAHDEWIQGYCEEHPECNERYDLRKSNGYGTAKHREGIRLYGGHELHRELYIQRWLPGSTHQAKTRQKTENKCLIQFKQ